MSQAAQPVDFTDAAARRVIELLEEENNAELKLRVLVQGGGCSGLRYGFEFTETVNDDDFIVEKSPEFPQGEDHSIKSVNLVIDQFSMVYLKGAIIDFRDDLSGTFVIKNPNAKTTCGCGSSFYVEDEDE